MNIDPWILTFSALTVIATIAMGFWSARKSKTASDFFVAGRSVSVGWNASAISGEYLSAASFMGVAGMVMSSGYDALWYPVCYACGYLFLLLFIAGPLRRFGAYTIPDFAEGRFDSPLFRKIAVIFVLFIGFFYTMPQMKGAGTTLAYIFPGLPYWVGVALVGAVITLNVALGGMKGITLVQAFQYWAKMFAISVPIFVLMSVYGHYGKQLGANGEISIPKIQIHFDPEDFPKDFNKQGVTFRLGKWGELRLKAARLGIGAVGFSLPKPSCSLDMAVGSYARYRLNISDNSAIYFDMQLGEDGARQKVQLNTTTVSAPKGNVGASAFTTYIKRVLATNGLTLIDVSPDVIAIVVTTNLHKFAITNGHYGKQLGANGKNFQHPTSNVQQNPEFAAQFYAFTKNNRHSINEIKPALKSDGSVKEKAEVVVGWLEDSPDVDGMETLTIGQAIGGYNAATRHTVWVENNLTNLWQNAKPNPAFNKVRTREQSRQDAENFLAAEGISVIKLENEEVATVLKSSMSDYEKRFAQWSSANESIRKPLPEKAPADQKWISPFGPLTSKAAKAAKPSLRYDGPMIGEPINGSGTSLKDAAKSTIAKISGSPIPRFVAMSGPVNVRMALQMLVPEKAQHVGSTAKLRLEIAESIRERELHSLVAIETETNTVTGRVLFTYKPADIEAALQKEGITLWQESENVFKAFPTKDAKIIPIDPRPYSLLYTYSLIIALVCGTAGLPHILVRFYTNPDGVAAKRTTMWVMILIGVFYVFPPVFGVMGRNLMPELYNGLTGVKGTDGIVLKLPRILNEKVGKWESEKVRGTSGKTGSLSHSPTFSPAADTASNRNKIPWGSILSGVTCAGAFAAFMSTFSGLLVSMTGALAHDVYGRIFRPKSTPDQRMRMFKICAVICGAGSILLGFLVKEFEINKMVGWAFAIAAASYFPLLFMSVWWRGMTMRGAAAGMLVGGMASLITVVSTMVADQAAWAKPLSEFFATHPLLRILCEQPAIWAVPLSITLMIVVSKLTRKEIPSDVRMKMLVLHAPEKLGLKQEYIQEHQAGH